MKNRHKQILDELNLLPLWRLKAGPRGQSIQSLAPPSTGASDSTLAVQTPEAFPQSIPVQQMDWDQLERIVSRCTKCPLHKTRTRTVFGVGDQNASWLFIGEGPGAREDELGEPFVGQAGKLLDQMLAAIQLKRGEQVYITNIVKCRPPNNRNPTAEEAKQCEPYLRRQIALLKPKLIVALGKVAAQNLLNCPDSISSLRGKIYDYAGIPVIVTYHPAYLLRSLPEKSKAWKDLCFAKATMQSLC